jgi:hypothetical protein
VSIFLLLFLAASLLFRWAKKNFLIIRLPLIYMVISILLATTAGLTAGGGAGSGDRYGTSYGRGIDIIRTTK